MGDLWRGIADGLADSRASSAEAAAGRLSVEADRARRDAYAAEARSDKNFERSVQLAQALQVWRNDALKLQAEASGYGLTLNAVRKAMDALMTPSEQERFRAFVANAARGRIQELDAQYRQENSHRLSIEKALSETELNDFFRVI